MTDVPTCNGTRYKKSFKNRIRVMLMSRNSCSINYLQTSFVRLCTPLHVEVIQKFLCLMVIRSSPALVRTCLEYCKSLHLNERDLRIFRRVTDFHKYASPSQTILFQRVITAFTHFLIHAASFPGRREAERGSSGTQPGGDARSTADT